MECTNDVCGMKRVGGQRRKGTEWFQVNGNKKMFWKEVKKLKKGEHAIDEMVKDVNGQILLDGVEVRRR